MMRVAWVIAGLLLAAWLLRDADVPGGAPEEARDEPARVSADLTQDVPGLQGTPVPASTPRQPPSEPAPGPRWNEAAGKPRDERPTVPVEGVVLRAEDGAPLAGATVRVFRVGNREEVAPATTSGARGVFRFERLPAREPLFIIARIDGWHAGGLARTLPSPEPLEIRLGGGCTLRGRVTDARGDPVGSALVWLLRPDRAIPPRALPRQWSMYPELSRFFYPQVRTDAEGRYEIRGITPGEPRVPVVWLSERAEVWGEALTFARVGEETVRDLRIPAFATLVYRVLDGDGQPVPDAQVDMDSARVWFRANEVATLEDDGWHAVAGVVPGRWHLRAWVPGGGLAEATVELEEGQRTQVTLRGPSGGSLTGVVLGPDEKPITGCMVSWSDGRKHAMVETAEDGRFTLTGLPDGPGVLQIQPMMGLGIRDGGRPLEPMRREGVRASDSPLEVVLHAKRRAHARIEGVVAGTVLRCEVHSRELHATLPAAVDADGRIAFDAPRSGLPWVAVIPHPTLAPQVLFVPAGAPGQPVDLGTLTFDEGTTMEGVVSGVDGAPLAGAEVRFTQRWVDRLVRTGADGRYRATRLPSVPLRLRVDARGHPPHVFTVEPTPPRTRRALALTAGGRLHCRVTGAIGTSVRREPTVSIHWTFDDPSGTDSGHLGLFYGLPPDGDLTVRLQAGRYRVTVRGPDGAWVHEAEVEIRDGVTTEFLVEAR